MIKNINIQVQGLVQGVFLRKNIKNKAKELNLKGFVQNQSDGSVIVEAEGEETNLIKLFKFIKNGPGLAKPKKIKYFFSKNMANFSTFKIID